MNGYNNSVINSSTISKTIADKGTWTNDRFIVYGAPLFISKLFDYKTKSFTNKPINGIIGVSCIPI